MLYRRALYNDDHILRWRQQYVLMSNVHLTIITDVSWQLSITIPNYRRKWGAMLSLVASGNMRLMLGA